MERIPTHQVRAVISSLQRREPEALREAVDLLKKVDNQGMVVDSVYARQLRKLVEMERPTTYRVQAAISSLQRREPEALREAVDLLKKVDNQGMVADSVYARQLRKLVEFEKNQLNKDKQNLNGQPSLADTIQALCSGEPVSFDASELPVARTVIAESAPGTPMSIFTLIDCLVKKAANKINAGDHGTAKKCLSDASTIISQTMFQKPDLGSSLEKSMLQSGLQKRLESLGKRIERLSKSS